MFSSFSTYLFILITFYGSVFVFLRGLLPVDQIDGQKFPLETNVMGYEGHHIDKMVLMIVDGLRADMLTGLQTDSLWPKLHSHLSERASVCSISHLQPPTVTMPRIKAITSGGIPKFIDVLHNFFTESLHHDTWVKRLISRGWSLEFYGDDTWLKLFPNTFSRFDGTTSFFVNDYYEVDNNVTRHLDKLTERSDEWNGLILHYLGLDHIGHVEGPRIGSTIDKLHEMDRVADKLLSHLAAMESQNNTNWLFILTGDHGISDQGGHGGSTYAEVHTGLAMISSKKKKALENPCFFETKAVPRSEQVDLATFIGLVVGGGIPAGSFGSVPIHWIQTFFPNETYTQLNILYRLMNHFAARAGCYSTALDFSFKLNMLTSVCVSASVSSDLVDRYNNLINRLRLAYEYRDRVDGQGDTAPQLQSLILDMSELVFQLQQTLMGTGHQLQVDLMVVGCILIWVVTIIVYILVKDILFRKESVLEYSPSQHWSGSSPRPSNLLLSYTSLRLLTQFLTACLVLQAVSLLASSFSEEEHQFWYYFSASSLGLLGVFIALQYPHRSSLVLTSDPVMLAWLAVLGLDRLLLRRLHQTGDKWIHLPDISDWLSAHTSCLWPTQLAAWIAFIFLRGMTVFKSSWPEHLRFRTHQIRWSPVLTACLMAISQLCYRWAVATGHGDGAVVAARIAYAVLAVDLLTVINWHRTCKRYQPIARPVLLGSSATAGGGNGSEKPSFWTDGFLHPVVSFALLVGFLGRPSVCLLWTGVLVKEYLLSRLIDQTVGAWRSGCCGPDAQKPRSGQSTELRVLATWLVYWTQGWVTFFQQGNSLSLATLDVSVAYVGFRGFHPAVAGLLLLVFTYAGPLYWQLAYLARFRAASANSLPPAGVAQRLAFARLAFVVLPVAFASTVCLLLREHLFIWTVFTPKLVYLALFQLVFAPVLCLVAIW